MRRWQIYVRFIKPVEFNDNRWHLLRERRYFTQAGALRAGDDFARWARETFGTVYAVDAREVER